MWLTLQQVSKADVYCGCIVVMLGKELMVLASFHECSALLFLVVTSEILVVLKD